MRHKKKIGGKVQLKRKEQETLSAHLAELRGKMELGVSYHLSIRSGSLSDRGRSLLFPLSQPLPFDFTPPSPFRVTLCYTRGFFFSFLKQPILPPVVPAEGKNYYLVCLVSLCYQGRRQRLPAVRTRCHSDCKLNSVQKEREKKNNQPQSVFSL